MFNKFFILLVIFINFLINLSANEKELIIDHLLDIKNITFDFEQITNNKKEIGRCILVFDNKLSCDYKDSMHKNILINNKTLVIHQKRYNKKSFYPISSYPFIKIFNKNNLIDLIKTSNYQLNDNIELSYTGKNKEKIIIFFKKDNYSLSGWRLVDQLQNIVNFSIDIKYINSEINPKIFKIPSIN
mgnify:FL=1